MITYQRPEVTVVTAHINDELVGYIVAGVEGWFAYDKLGISAPAINKEPLQSINHCKALLEYSLRNFKSEENEN